MRWKVLPTEEEEGEKEEEEEEEEEERERERERERAIILKLVGSEVAPDLCMRVMLETDQQVGAEPVKGVLVKSAARKWCVQGRCFRKP